ncbi:MAG: class I SAM-dependent methyltransferase [Candidatus Omnitrophica bacterium]|nr:class I SAM-dependent methyltransferase [Candidatus Omnitrophota bacterium]
MHCPQTMNRQLWEKEAREGKKECERGEYLSGLFREALNRGITHLVPAPRRWSLLKTDLWNEGVDSRKDVLGHYAGGGFSLYGVDIAADVIRAVAEPSIRSAQAALGALPFKRGSFDMLLDLSTLDHIPHAASAGVIADYRRILKKDGVLVMAVDSWGFFWRLYYLYQRRLRRMEVGVFPGTDIPNQYRYQPKALCSLLTKQGFAVCEEYCIDWFGWSWNRLTLRMWRHLMRHHYRGLIRWEYSRWSKYMKAFAKQYVIIARNQEGGE